MQRYLDILNHFGLRAQMKKFNEETYEFLEAIANHSDYVANNENDASSGMKEMLRECIVKELGDILILATEFMAYYEINSIELNSAMDAQLEKIESHIKDILDKENKL